MLHLFVLAGVPMALASIVTSSDLKKAAGERGHILLKASLDNAGCLYYSVEYVNKLVICCKKWIAQRGVDEQFSVSLIYANDGGPGSRLLVSKFSEFSLVADFHPLAVPRTGNERRRIFKKFIPRLQSICSSLRSRGKIMCDHVHSSMRRTPLLLPLRNFNSQNLNHVISRIMLGAYDAHNLDQFIKEAILEFNRSASTYKPDGSPRRYYCNVDGLVFVTPGNHQLHGIVHDNRGGSGHLASCYIHGRVRLGGSFNPRFHYDCSPMRGDLKSHYKSCHGQDVRPKAPTHVNIAPNDWIR